MRAEIIAVGSELLTPYRLDTNSLFLTAGLNQVGIRVVHKAVVGDSPDDMRASFRHALDRADLVVACGGLGPTDDDRTREAVADLLGRKLDIERRRAAPHPGTLSPLRPRDAGNQSRARRWCPKAPPFFRIRAARAPGLWIEASGHIVILLPGVSVGAARAVRTGSEAAPREARARRAPVHARPAHHRPSRIGSRAARLAALRAVSRHRNHDPRVADREFSSIRASGRAIPPKPKQMLDEIVERMALALGEHLYSTAGETLEEVVARVLTENRATIAVAESCTGGLLAERLTNIPGSSVYFLGGVVCYSNELKTRWSMFPQS